MKHLKLLQIFSTLLMLCMVQTARAAAVSATWNGSLSGNQAWNNASNWNPGADYPHNGANTYAATVINNSAGALSIQTPTSATTISRFQFNQSGSGSTTLKLGSDFSITSASVSGGPAASEFLNSNAASPGKLVLDLNGHTFSAATGSTTTNRIQYSRNYTIRDTSVNGDGIFELSAISYDAGVANGRVNVENNVTVKVTSAASGLNLRGALNSLTEGWNFAPTATLWIAGAGDPSASSLGGPLGNVIVGTSTNVNRTRWRVSGDFSVGGNVVYESSTSGSGSFIGIGNGATMTLSGNITDKNTNTEDYASTLNTNTTILFVGGLAKEQEVWIAKQGLTTRFQVGVDAATRGNVKLLNDLTTTANNGSLSGALSVTQGSRLNLDTYKLTASRVNFATSGLDPTLALTFGENSNALIHVTSTVAADFRLGSFNLELTYNGEGWENGSNLLLFRYEGASFTGTPTLANFDAPSILSHDGLAWGNINGVNYIYLQNVTVVPEPTAITLLAVGAFAFLLRRRRFGNRQVL